MLRASSYTIYVDLPQRPEEVLLVHGYTGACDKVTRPVAKYLRRIEVGEDTPPGGFRPSDATLDVLTRRGYLTARTADDEHRLMERLAAKLDERARQQKPNVVLMPTYGCNLRCPYCFQAHVRENGAAARALRTMSRELVDRIFDALPRLDERHGVTTDQVAKRGYLFYGGEPFLRSSRPIVDYIVEKARAFSPCTFTAISNGTELDAYADLLGPDGLTFVQITLDGPPAIHDLRRIHADGRGSFEQIARNVDLALGRQVAISLRVNVDATNIDGLPALGEEIVRAGWHGRRGFAAYLSPVHGSDGRDGGGARTTSWALATYLDEMQRRHESMKVFEGPSAIRSRAVTLLRSAADPFLAFTAKHCTALSNTYIFDPRGDVYSCFEDPGRPDKRIGRLLDDGSFAFEPLDDQWRGRSTRNTAKCVRCRYSLLCGGGCAQGSMREGRGFHGSFCDGLPRFFRRAAAEVYEELAASRSVSAAEPAPECVR